jgi:flagellar motor switch protein FliN/FliY
MNSTPHAGTSPSEKPKSGIPPECRSLLEQLKPFRKIPMNVSVELGRGKLNLRDLLELRYHSIFKLDQHAGARLNVFVNGVLLGRGEPVVLEDHMGIKIDEIADSQR